jgi:di/tricarboxylate transporter
MQVSELIVFAIGFCITLISAFWLLLTLLFKQFEKNITSQFEALEEDAKEWARLEKDFLMFQRDLPLHYVRREDYVRNQSVIESKLDSLALKLENWQLKGASRNAN